ncbi:heterokaryon incompatibility protein-domain-containing protein [Hyaloscypha finlandica]|nr:heterokaryon incompatibility protein-domain-containing protein [Hyaloscypha finlandica]
MHHTGSGLVEYAKTTAATNTGAEEVLRLATQWISDCVKNHEKCKAKESSSRQLPTRLISVGPAGSPTVRLCHTKFFPRETLYMTLSHCCKLMFLKLTSQNHALFEDGLPLKDLPKTFQDAILFTRRTPVEYIWIDSLCILQDSEDDWQDEAVRMEHVYSNAYCNIAATAGSHTQSGCFVERDVNACLPVIVSLAPQFHASLSALYQSISQIGSTDSYHSVGFDPGKYICHEVNLWEREITSSILMRRAWVFQERFLAKRVLHFASSQIFFECHTIQNCEIWPRGMDYAYYSMKKSKSRFAEGLGIWVLMVEDYTACALTYETDRLTAIAGLARYMKPILKCSYIAGLWKDSLVLQLLWRSAGRGNRASRYQAPTWPWASRSGQVISALIQSPFFFWDGFPQRGGQTAGQNSGCGGQNHRWK